MARHPKVESVNMSIDELLKTVAAGLNDVSKRPNLYNYKPHPKQVIFHRSPAAGKLFLGGNRSGKTVAGITEDLQTATGRHPYRKHIPIPNEGRIVTVDYINGWEKIIKPVVKQFIPPSDLINGSWEDSWQEKNKLLTLDNGSTIEVMSHEQPLEKFAGVPRDWTHFDEECPQAIFKECILRLVDRSGRWWMTMTPVEGMTWVYDDIYEKYKTGALDANTDVIEVDMDDNPYLSEEGKAIVLAGLTDEEIQVRKKGQFVAIGGLIFNQFNYDMHVVEHIYPPYEWEWWRSIDLGIRNPTAVLYHAINPKGGVYTFAEHYRSDWTIKMHTERLHEMDENLGKVPEYTVGDPAMQQRSQITGHSHRLEFSKNGIPVAMANNAVEPGLDKMNEYLRQGKWIISNECVNLIREIRKYHRKKYSSPKLNDQNNPREEPQKKDDHAIDSARYLFSFRPELTPLKDGTKVTVNATVADLMAQNQGVTGALDMRRARVYPWQRDPNVTRIPQPDRGWGEI